MKITVYTVSDCQFSQAEKEYLKLHNLPFEEKNLEQNREWLTEMLAVSNNFAGTPVTKIEKDDGTIVVLKGFTKEEFDKELGLNQPEVAQVNAQVNVPPPQPAQTQPAVQPPPSPPPSQPAAPAQPVPPPPVAPPSPTTPPPQSFTQPQPTPAPTDVNQPPTQSQSPNQALDQKLNEILNNLEEKTQSNPPSQDLPNIPDFTDKQ